MECNYLPLFYIDSLSFISNLETTVSKYQNVIGIFNLYGNRIKIRFQLATKKNIQLFNMVTSIKFCQILVLQSLFSTILILNVCKNHSIDFISQYLFHNLCLQFCVENMFQMHRTQIVLSDGVDILRTSLLNLNRGIYTVSIQVT